MIVKNKYCVVRTFSAGAWAGTVQFFKGKEVHLTGARRLWYWDGAASLSELAAEGVLRPQECKFPCAVDVVLTEAIEIIPATKKAERSIKRVKVWTAKNQ